MLAAGNTFAQGMGGGRLTESPPIPDVDKESLIFSVPQRWYPYSRSTDDKDETFIFPTGDSPDDWNDMLRIEQYKTTLGVTSAMQVHELKQQSNSEACERYSNTLQDDKPENGYSMALWFESCDMASGDSRVMLTKTVVGAERLYVVTRIWTEQPGERDVERWQQELTRMFVCDPNTGVNPCAPPGSTARGAGRPPR